MEKQNLFLNGEISMPYGIGIGIEHNEFFNSSWENPTDQNDPFESALSSMVSSPATSNAAGVAAAATAATNNSGGSGNFVLRELIGRLGSFDNSGEISPAGCTNSSCYNTPLNSPPKLNLSSMVVDHQIRGPTNFPIHPGLPQFTTDPGFAERAARFSCFSDKGLVNSGKGSGPIKAHGSQTPSIPEKPALGKKFTPENSELIDSRENSSVSEQIPVGEIAKNDSNSRKRKAAAKGKAKETTPSSSSANAAPEKNESNPKRIKSDEKNSGNDEDLCGNDKAAGTENKENPKAAEPPKDYIHVRARRGQATDAHSLAERVRREKISERMKLLQDLVPGCNKVTGKAVMLDEIINYVQSLQRQVEFLSMKLATINPRVEFNMEALLSKDLYQYRGPTAQNMFPSDVPYSFQSMASLPNLQSVLPKGSEVPFPINPLNANGTSRNLGLALPPMDTFLDPASQVPAFFEDDLNSVVQMGFGQNQTQNFHGTVGTSEMKVEL